MPDVLQLMKRVRQLEAQLFEADLRCGAVDGLDPGLLIAACRVAAECGRPELRPRYQAMADQIRAWRQAKEGTKS